MNILGYMDCHVMIRHNINYNHISIPIVSTLYKYHIYSMFIFLICRKNSFVNTMFAYKIDLDGFDMLKYMFNRDNTRILCYVSRSQFMNCTNYLIGMCRDKYIINEKCDLHDIWLNMLQKSIKLKYYTATSEVLQFVIRSHDHLYNGIFNELGYTFLNGKYNEQLLNLIVQFDTKRCIDYNHVYKKILTDTRSFFIYDDIMKIYQFVDIKKNNWHILKLTLEWSGYDKNIKKLVVKIITDDVFKNYFNIL